MRFGIIKTLGLFSAVSMFSGCMTGPQHELVSDSEKVYEKVISVPGVSSDDIYSSTRTWLAENFVSSKAVIEYANKEEGVVIGNGITEIPCADSECWIYKSKKAKFSMRIDIKDERYKSKFFNLEVYVRGSDYMKAGYYEYVTKSELDRLKVKFDDLNQSLKSHIERKEKNSDW